MGDERAEISLDGDESCQKVEQVQEVGTPRISERPMSSVQHIERPIEHIRSPAKLHLFGSAVKTTPMAN